ncbi:MAG: AI-2E family transporter [Ornithinimicrobium sp.]
MSKPVEHAGTSKQTDPATENEPGAAAAEQSGATDISQANPAAGEQRDAEEAEASRESTALDRGLVFGAWLSMAARWFGRAILVGLGVVLALWALSTLWAGVLPVILALILTALLMPMKQWLLGHKVGHALSAIITLITMLVVVFGTLTFIAPDVVRQMQSIGAAAQGGIDQLQTWLARGPLNLDNTEINSAVERATTWIKTRSGDIAAGAFSGVSAAGSLVINLILILALTFFFLKDGHRFLPWQRSVVGRGAGQHLTEVLTRNWTVLGGFIRTQALVSAIDAVLIGAGLFILGVPLALALTVITFFAGFIPIVGAITAGALAVLVALVSNGWQTALIIVVIIVLVQQLEGNVLSPMLQGKTMSVHPGLILVTVTIGGTLFGIVGVFLAVPLTASLVATARYIGEQLDLRTGLLRPDEVTAQTPEGALAAQEAEHTSAHYRAIARKKRASLKADTDLA